MIIYESDRAGFLADVENKQLQPKLELAFLARTGSIPNDRSTWESAYTDIAWDLREAAIADEVRVAIEYHLSAAGRFRIDVLLAGSNADADAVVLVELKGWEWAEASNIPEVVTTLFGGRETLTQHPCAQVLGYREFIVHFNEDIARHAIDVHACAFLHRYRRNDPEPLEATGYAPLIAQAPMFLLDDRHQLREFLGRHVPRGPRGEVLWILEHGRLRPSRYLAEAVTDMLRGNPVFRLIDAQRVAFNVIKAHIDAAGHADARRVFVIRGGPGTGKSVIAMQLLADLYKRGRLAFFVAPNAAFRNTLAENLSRGGKDGRRLAKLLLRSSYSFHDQDWHTDRRNEVLIVDEAHRLKNGKAHQYRGQNMVADAIRAAQTSVFFIDETQQVSWNDIGSIDEIHRQARALGVEVQELPELTAQFRCSGSTGYLNWVDDVLQIRETGNFDNWGDDQYEFAVFDRPEGLYDELKARNGKNRARLIAGYAWEWPSTGRTRGSQMAHVRVGDLELPWNYHGENWATAEDGIGQVGCIHTCQGVEFDWVGILIGEDLVYRNNKVIGLPEKRARTDKSLHGWKKALAEAGSNEVERQRVLDRVQRIIRNTYKVLLTRGQKGCLVWCADVALRNYLRDRLSLCRSVEARRAAERGDGYQP